MLMLKNKKILVSFILILLVTISMFLVFNKSHAYKELPKVKIKDSIINSGLAIMVESDYKSGEYQKLDSNIFPTDGYTLNKTKSGCVDSNGKTVDALIYNESDKTISIKTKQSIYCYLYYDNIFKGDGTKENPFRLYYIEDLVELSNSVNKDKNTYADKYFELMRSLDFKEKESYENSERTDFGDINGVSNDETLINELTNPEGSGFESIGSYTNQFEGNIDGKNNKISNLWIYNKNKINQAIGFIGALSNGSISNLTINGIIETTQNANIGGIVGSITNTQIENCHDEVNITSQVGSYSIGGIVGVSNGTANISNCTNNSSISGSNNAGGIVGINSGNLTIENCQNYGDITNNLGEYLGGIIGRDNGATNETNIIDSNNSGTLTINSEKQTTSVCMGGLVGKVSGTLNIQNSNNENSSKIMELEVKGEVWPYMGGLIGMGDGAKITVDSAKNEQSLKITNNSTKDLKIAGILSYIKNKGNFETNNVQNIGNMEINDKSNANPYIGGILGLINSSSTTTINKTKNVSKEIRFNSNDNKTSFLDVGGIIGCTEGNVTAKIVESYNMANVYGGTKLGGIIAYTWNNSKVLIDKCYNTGNFETNDKSDTSPITIGGLIGYNCTGSTSYIVNSYNIGNLKNNADLTDAFMGGLIGNISSKTTNGGTHNYIINSYNLGKMVRLILL